MQTPAISAQAKKTQTSLDYRNAAGNLDLAGIDQPAAVVKEAKPLLDSVAEENDVLCAERCPKIEEEK